MLDRVLALRPTNAASRLGRESRVPVLNPRDIVRGLGDPPAAILCVPVTVRGAVAGLLRAARDQDAPLGLSCPFPLSGRDSPERFFDAIRQPADDLGHWRPLFLQVGPVRISSTDSRTLERTADQLFKFVDAGFGLVSLDASTLEPDEAAEAYRQVAQAALERELSIEVTVPTREGRARKDGLKDLLDALQGLNAVPRFVRVESKSLGVEVVGTGEWDIDLNLIGELREVAHEVGASLAIDERDALSVRWAGAWAKAGARKIDAHDRFGRIVLNALPKSRASSIVDFAGLEQGQETVASLEVGVRDRIEALWYGEAFDLIETIGGVGTGSRAMRFLSEQAGY